MNKVWRLISYIMVAALSTVVTLAVCFAGGIYPEKALQSESKLVELADLIDSRFIGEHDRKAYEDAAAEAMVDSLGDQWSYYMTAEDYVAYVERMNNAYVGIGITIQVKEEQDGFLVLKVNEGGPADKAGMLAGDILIGIEGTSTAEMTADDARTLIRGKEETEVRVTVLRVDREIELTIIRGEVQTPVAEATLLNGGVGLITITNFDARCADETIAAIETLRNQGAWGLIFDVRNNPGGYKHELVEVLDYLLPEGPLFRSEDYLGNVTVDESDADCLIMPMAVLVNGDSYSAAEFFAAAMGEYEAAMIVGQQTTGKGYFQQTFRLEDGSAVGLSVGKYSTPNGVNLAGVGITPDIVVDVDENTAFEIYAGLMDPNTDPQIQAAIEAMKGQ